MLAYLRKVIQKGERGFTLIELVVVLVILGLLIALALPSYFGARRRAAQEEARGIGQEWRTLAWACYLLNGAAVSCVSDNAIGFSETNVVHWQFGTPTGHSYSYVTGSTITLLVTATANDPLVSGDAYSITLTIAGAGAGQATDSFSGP